MPLDLAAARSVLSARYAGIPGYLWAGAAVLGAIVILPRLRGAGRGAAPTSSGVLPAPSGAPSSSTLIPYGAPGDHPNHCGAGTYFDPGAGACLPIPTVTPARVPVASVPPASDPGLCGPGQYWDGSRCVFPPGSTAPNAPSMQPPRIPPPPVGTPAGAGSTVPTAPIGDPTNYGPCGAFYSVALGRNMPRGSGAPGDPGCGGMGGPAIGSRGSHLWHTGGHPLHKEQPIFPHYVRARGGAKLHHAEIHRVARQTGVHPARLMALNPRYTGVIRVA